MGALGVYIGCRIYNVNFMKAIDAVAPGLVLAQAIGRWGTSSMATPGARQPTPSFPSPTPILIRSSRTNCSMFRTHPYPVYDMALNLLVFALIWKLRTRPMPDGALFAIFLISYGIGRFFIHGWFRQEDIWLLNMQQAQVFSLLGAAVGAAMLAVLYYRDRPEDTSPSTSAEAA